MVFQSIQTQILEDLTEEQKTTISAAIEAVLVPGQIVGTPGNDILVGTNNPNLILGLDGDDGLFGLDGDDTVFGGAGVDIIIGGGGNDQLFGEDGNDIIFGDTQIFGIGGNDFINGGNGNDVIFGEAGNDTVNGDAGDDVLNGDEGNDILNGGDGVDVINGGNGDDRLSGGFGDDRLFGNAGNDELFGDVGNDIFFGGEGNDRLFGGLGDDELFGDIGNDELFGDDGNDIINGGAGDDLAFGGLGNDRFFLSAGNDRIFGGEGNDLADGEAGDDILNGEGGDDILFGSLGNDTLTGDAGTDILVAGVGNDSLSGGVGNDTLIGVDPFVFAPPLFRFGGGEIDTLGGGAGSDTFFLGDNGTVLNNTRVGPGAGPAVYYLGGGNSDYALITDFNIVEDRIQLPLNPPQPATAIEIGDAGQLLPSAQVIPGGTGTLNSISGTVSSTSDVDLFRITLSGGAFSATTVGTGTFFDTQLFLFNAAGFGVLSNDQAGFTSQSTISSASLPAGDYFLAISGYNNDPISAGGLIFPDFPFDQILGPTGPGGGSPLSGFSSSSFASSGNYKIDLTGVQGAATTFSLNASPVGFPSGTGISFGNDLIAIVQGVEVGSLNLTGSNFVFV